MRLSLPYILISLIIIGLTGGVITSLRADGTNAVATVAAKSTPAKDNAPAAQKPAKHTLTGAELYSIHCNRCHPERYPTERTAAQWKTIMLHMQIRASIPGKQARLILQYLQENSGR